ncbi:hypothetical protein CA13_05220 [Planctomycetes bacterium CA13]|uniref:Uncharacterized protein n=1 Tax=Novipirellula herctigrandis TaxID=2527986 RepID=A0A5C5YVR9_9BACT|nr:hypothetical protein CA13_05220 [Planctomycetes bacterium CA13]
MSKASIEYHYASDRWFLSRIENEKFYDFACVDGDPNELIGRELCGSWPNGTSNSQIADGLYSDLVTSKRQTVVVRGLRYRVCSFAAFHCGYDMIRFALAPVQSIAKGGAK